jgi:hypothetical protein
MKINRKNYIYIESRDSFNERVIYNRLLFYSRYFNSLLYKYLK